MKKYSLLIVSIFVSFGFGYFFAISMSQEMLRESNEIMGMVRGAVLAAGSGREKAVLSEAVNSLGIVVDGEQGGAGFDDVIKELVQNVQQYIEVTEKTREHITDPAFLRNLDFEISKAKDRVKEAEAYYGK